MYNGGMGTKKSNAAGSLKQKRLLEVAVGKSVRVASFEGGLGVSSTLRQLGMLPGERVRVLRRAPLRGPLMVEVKGRSIAIGRGIAAKIFVDEGG